MKALKGILALTLIAIGVFALFSYGVKIEEIAAVILISFGVSQMGDIENG